MLIKNVKNTKIFGTDCLRIKEVNFAGKGLKLIYYNLIAIKKIKTDDDSNFETNNKIKQTVF